MTNDYRGLGFDPAPGDHDAVAAASQHCASAAARAGAAARAARAARGAGDRSWAGGAADAAWARLDRIPSTLDNAGRLLETTSAILDEWTGTLLGNQRLADQLDRRARQCLRAMADASDQVDRATTAVQFTAGPGAADAEAARVAAVARHDALRRELDAIRDAARVLARDHLAEATRVASAR